jgi:hypothetical protein
MMDSEYNLSLAQELTETAESSNSDQPDFVWCDRCKTFHKNVEFNEDALIQELAASIAKNVDREIILELIESTEV